MATSKDDWRDKLVTEFDIPLSKFRHLHDVLGLDDFGDVADAIESGRDLGLNKTQLARVKLEIDTARAALPQPTDQELNEAIDALGGSPAEIDTAERSTQDTLEAAREEEKKGERFIVMTEEAYPEIFELMESLIEANHPKLVDSEARIKLIWDMKDSHSEGEVVAGKSRRCTPLETVETGHHYAIHLNARIWAEYDAERRSMQMDEQLFAFVPEFTEEDDKGKVGWKFKIRKAERVSLEMATLYGERYNKAQIVLQAVKGGGNLFNQG